EPYYRDRIGKKRSGGSLKRRKLFCFSLAQTSWPLITYTTLRSKKRLSATTKAWSGLSQLLCAPATSTVYLSSGIRHYQKKPKPSAYGKTGMKLTLILLTESKK